MFKREPVGYSIPEECKQAMRACLEFQYYCRRRYLRDPEIICLTSKEFSLVKQYMNWHPFDNLHENKSFNANPTVYGMSIVVLDDSSSKDNSKFESSFLVVLKKSIGRLVRM